MKNQIVLDSDPLFICERLKEVDKSYYVVYDFSKNKFEVHSSEQRGGSYCFTVPFDTLDERAITFAKKTSVLRQDEVIKEIDLENQKLERNIQKKAVERLKEVIYES